MSCITAIATANPEHRISQPDIAAFMLRAMTFQNGESRMLKTIFKASGIQFRHSVLADYGRTSDFDFYPENFLDPFPSTQQRLKIFRDTALPLSTLAARRMFDSTPHIQPSEITHLIVVSCTGMYAPGLDIDLVKSLKLATTVHRTAINFMGCYAAFNALKIADAFCSSVPSAKVLIVCTELCSLHFQRAATTDNMLANALFADGSAAVLVEGKSHAPLQLEIQGFYNDLSSEGIDDMAWSIGDVGFEMRLSAYVPDIIRDGIAQLTDALLAHIRRQWSEIKHFAIHPGGKKILEAVEQALKISPSQNSAAYHVLKNFGNMSSPTILFVLAEMIKNFRQENEDESIVGFAFGPGLTMESMLLGIKRVSHA